MIEFTLGLDTALTDFSTVFTASYRYWVHTRDLQGHLSDGAFVEVIGSGGTTTGTTTVVSTGSGFWCWASVGTEASLWPLAVSVVLFALSFRR